MDFIIWNSNGHEIYSSIDQIHRVYIKECNSRSQKFECNIDGCKKRHGKVKNEDGSVYAITDNKDLVRSSKLFKKNLNLYLKLIDKAIKYRNDLATKYSDNISRILHNVITLTSQNMQEIYSLVPQNVLTSDLKDQLKTIRSHISSDLDESAKIMFRLIKNNILIKTEFQVYKTLNNPDQLLTKREHDLKKVVLNAFHAFFYDFKSKGIYVNIENCNRKLNINYPTLTGALVHFIDNAAKYSMSDSIINVTFESNDNHLVLSFDMMSYKISDEDMEHLFDEGYSGFYSTKNDLNGDGMGMRMIRQLLSLNNCEFVIRKNINPNKSINGILAEFDLNRFDMVFSM